MIAETNFDHARFNMIEQQIRPWEVLDQQVLDLMYQVPREEFVPKDYRNLAFADMNIPLPHQQVMMKPNVEGRLLQALALNPQDQVLEIGTGSGYLTALLAKAANHVDSVDVFADFVSEAKTKLDALGITNVSLEVGDASNGWNLHKQYDIIVITGALPKLPSHLREQIRAGGCIFAVVGEAPIMRAQVLNHLNEEEWHTDELFETWLPPLVGAVPRQPFVL